MTIRVPRWFTDVWEILFNTRSPFRGGSVWRNDEERV